MEIDGIKRGDASWDDIVLVKLMERGDKNVINGRPTTKSLRSFIQTLCKVRESYPTQILPVGLPGATADVALRGCTVLWRLTIEVDNSGLETYGGEADAFPDNLVGKFASYPAPMAGVRAEGRALVRALGLSLVTHEEVSGSNASDSEDGDAFYKAKAQPINYVAIDNAAKKANVNQTAVFAHHKKDPRTVNRGDAISIMSFISSLSRKDIPEEFLNYDPNWLSQF